MLKYCKIKEKLKHLQTQKYNMCALDILLPESKGLICLMRVAIAGVSLDLVFGSAAEGSSVSMGAKVSPSRPMPSNRPPAEESTDTASDSAG